MTPRIVPDIHCPTWSYEPHGGWRGFLTRRLHLPKRWFKPEKKSRVIYQLPDGTMVCSPDTYFLYQKALTERGGETVDKLGINILPKVYDWK